LFCSLQVRKDKFKDFEAVPKELDLVEEEDQFTHLVTLDDATDGQDLLSKSQFRFPLQEVGSHSDNSRVDLELGDSPFLIL
jgi:hypothetical protein